jgi:tryptophan halogenase
MTDESNRIRKIVVCGGGTAGWMAAAGLARMLGPSQVAITLIESSEIGTVGVGEATIPPILQFNQMLGLDEREFMNATGATYKLGIEFVDWLRPGHRYMHPFGLFGADMSEISFHHFWLRAVSLGMSDDLMPFNAEMMAAYAGKFARTGGNQPNGPRIYYAYQFDASAYAALLREYAVARGVERIDSKIEDVILDQGNGYIAAVALDDGRKVEGDFFIDCTGFRALLIGKALGSAYEDWSRWLPCNRAVAVPCARKGDPHPFTRTTARPAGWQWRIPLQHRTGNGTVYCDAFADEQTITDALLASLDGEPMADPNPLRFTAGRRKKSWVGNCLAVGLSSGFLEPLESTSIHLIQTAITWFLSFFPEREVDPSIIDRFNADMDVLVTATRDFIVSHYKLTERNDSEFWRHCQAMPIPDTLAERLEHFARRGEVFARHGELFKEVNWFAILYGQGLRPRGWHPMANQMPVEDLKRNMEQIAEILANRVKGMPPHLASLSQ